MVSPWALEQNPGQMCQVALPSLMRLCPLSSWQPGCYLSCDVAELEEVPAVVVEVVLWLVAAG